MGKYFVGIGHQTHKKNFGERLIGTEQDLTIYDEQIFIPSTFKNCLNAYH